MRKGVAGSAAAEARRVRDAIDEARFHLARLAFDIAAIKARNPKQEHRHLIAAVKSAVELLPEIPNNLPAIALLRSVIPALERTRPAGRKSRGQSADLWQDRNELIVETLKLIHKKYGFNPTRSDATKDKYDDSHCGSLIISKALKELEIQLSWFEKFGRKKPAIALSENTIKDIWEGRSSS